MMLREPDESSLRKQVEKNMGRRIPDSVWDAMLHTGRVQTLGSSPTSVADLADEADMLIPYRHLLLLPWAETPAARSPARPAEVTEREAPYQKELDALTQIMSFEAGRRPEVTAFRREVLEERLMPVLDVPKWVQEQCASAASAQTRGLDSPPSMAATPGGKAAIPEEEAPVPTRLPPWPGRDKWVSISTLAYPDPHRPSWMFGAQLVPLPASGPLRRLKWVAVSLMQDYPWSEAGAVRVILCGDASTEPVAVITRYFFHPHRVVLEVDPALGATQVATEYRRAQRALIRVGKRARPQSEKHLRLAAFLARGREGTWAQMMETWNEHQANAGWRYRDSRLFQRDAEGALRRLGARRPKRHEEAPGVHTEHVFAA